MVALMALGGHASTNPHKLSEVESIRLIQRAVDEGITFMDNAWDYHDGVAEERMGKALAAAGRRDKVFLMTKVCGRTAKEAQSNLEDSLRRLQTDRIDLLPITTLVSGIDSEKVLDQNLQVVRNFKPLPDAELRAIEQRTLALAGDGRFELFKTSKDFDGPVHRKQHGFATG